MKRIIIIVIAAAILALIILLIFYRPSTPASPEATNYPSSPSTAAYEPPKTKPGTIPAVPPISTAGMTLNADQKAKLEPILKAEEAKIAKIVQNQKLKPAEKSAQIHQTFEADRSQKEKILPGDQYRRLVLIENEWAGEMLAAQQ
jgi:hypothetical protein